MPITTRTIWPIGSLEHPNRSGVFKEKLDMMKDLGQTDGSCTEEITPEGEVVVRTWASLEAAEEWNYFSEPYGPIQMIIQET